MDGGAVGIETLVRVLLRTTLGALAFGALAAGTPVAALADLGAGVGASPIELAPAALPGHAYPLPSLYVVNTGTVPSSFRLSVVQLAPHQGQAVPPGWITFARNNIPLTPKQFTSVGLTLSLPSDAGPGSYQSDLVVGTAPVRSGSGAIAGAQAATKLLFTVGEGRGGFPWPWAWWNYAILAMVLLAAGAAVLQRHFHFHLQVQRRS